MALKDPLSRFSERVADYVRFRPSYPEALIGFLAEACGLREGDWIADVGAGTGKLSELLVGRGWQVELVEPNAEMMEAARAILGERDDCHFHPFAAESLGKCLAEEFYQLITVAQAFHWIDPQKFREAAREVLLDHGYVALIWNSRRRDEGFMCDYHELLLEMVPEYEFTSEKSEDLDRITLFYGHRDFVRRSFPYRQELDWAGLKGRLMSASYCPLPPDPMHDAVMNKLQELFERYQENGQVVFEYDTVVYLGQLPYH